MKPKDTHWPPAGVRDLGSKEPKNAGALKVRFSELTRPKKPQG